MELIPAIDLLGGRVVRLERGDYERVTVFSNDPLELAHSYASAGATRLHVVDLDGARDGSARHAELIARIARDAKLQVQVGGGIRTRDAALAWRDRGASRVVLGTSAVKDRAMVQKLCAEWPRAIVVALDANAGKVAVEGWVEKTDLAVTSFAVEVDAWSPAAILFTAIERDGTGTGPDVRATADLQSRVACDVIASGGIGALDHIRALAKAGVRSTVCGRALLDKAFSLTEAFGAAEESA